jgi:hypothetical protein
MSKMRVSNKTIGNFIDEIRCVINEIALTASSDSHLVAGDATEDGGLEISFLEEAQGDGEDTEYTFKIIPFIQRIETNP